MKIAIKITLLICILLSGIISVNAQKYPKKRFTADIRMGMNITEMDIEGANMDKQPKFGMHFGGNFNYKIVGNFQVQTGFYVTKKGLKQHSKVTSDPSIGGSYTVTETWYEATGNYIQMPFNVGYELYFTKKMAFNINGGVYVAYGYGNRGKTIYRDQRLSYDKDGQVTGTEYINEPYEVDTFNPQRWKRPDYGLNGSIGFIYDIYTINFNYERGLHNVTNESNKDLKHRIYSISLGFRF